MSDCDRIVVTVAIALATWAVFGLRTGMAPAMLGAVLAWMHQEFAVAIAGIAFLFFCIRRFSFTQPITSIVTDDDDDVIDAEYEVIDGN